MRGGRAEGHGGPAGISPHSPMFAAIKCRRETGAFVECTIQIDANLGFPQLCVVTCKCIGDHAGGSQ